MLSKFNIEDEVMTTKDLRNDGTFPGYDRGAVIVGKGEKGVIVDQGYFLQNILIYTVYFEKGFIVGCMEREIELAG